MDIGSNSIRYMEAQLDAGQFFFSPKNVYTTRLAEGMLQSGKLSDVRMEQSVSVLIELARRAEGHGFPVFAYATSAVRDAVNRLDFLSRVEAQTGIVVDVLSGEAEAAYAFGAATDDNGGMIDIGGGSSQIVTASFRQSYPFGCVRIKDICGDLPYRSICERMQPLFDKSYLFPSFDKMEWTAVGGTATTLAALHLGLSSYDPRAITGSQMTREELEALLCHLDAMGDRARRECPLLEKRHDVIPYGGAIFVYLLHRLGVERVRFSDADGMEGYAIHRLSR